MGKASVMAEPGLQPMHKGKESQIYSHRLACGLLEGGSARQEMQIKRGYSGLGRRRERKAPQKRWQSLKRSLKSNAVEGAESQPLCQSPSRWEAAASWRGFCLALAWLSVKHGSVLRRARGRCRARSHRSCQAVPEPHTAATHTPNKGETRNAPWETRGYVRTQRLEKPENQVSQPFCDLLSFWR